MREALRIREETVGNKLLLQDFGVNFRYRFLQAIYKKVKS